jgi:hypothetical protein
MKFTHNAQYNAIKNELETLFVEQGIRIVSIEPIILGRGAHSRDVRRALVVSNRNLD